MVTCEILESNSIHLVYCTLLRGYLRALSIANGASCLRTAHHNRRVVWQCPSMCKAAFANGSGCAWRQGSAIRVDTAEFNAVGFTCNFRAISRSPRSIRLRMDVMLLGQGLQCNCCQVVREWGSYPQRTFHPQFFAIFWSSAQTYCLTNGPIIQGVLLA